MIWVYPYFWKHPYQGIIPQGEADISEKTSNPIQHIIKFPKPHLSRQMLDLLLGEACVDASSLHPLNCIADNKRSTQAQLYQKQLVLNKFSVLSKTLRVTAVGTLETGKKKTIFGQ